MKTSKWSYFDGVQRADYNPAGMDEMPSGKGLRSRKEHDRVVRTSSRPESRAGCQRVAADCCAG